MMLGTCHRCGAKQVPTFGLRCSSCLEAEDQHPYNFTQAAEDHAEREACRGDALRDDRKDEQIQREHQEGKP